MDIKGYISHLYMPNAKKKRKQIIQTQSLQHHKLRQINLINLCKKLHLKNTNYRAVSLHHMKVSCLLQCDC